MTPKLCCRLTKERDDWTVRFIFSKFLYVNSVTENTKETLRTSVLPYRNMASAVKVAREMGLSVTKKQVRGTH